MKKFAVTALATLLAFSAALPATTSPAEARHRGAAIVGGVILGAAALAIIANSNRAHASESYNDNEEARLQRWRDQCAKWDYRCANGSEYACDKLSQNCDGY